MRFCNDPVVWKIWQPLPTLTTQTNFTLPDLALPIKVWVPKKNISFAQDRIFTPNRGSSQKVRRAPLPFDRGGGVPAPPSFPPAASHSMLKKKRKKGSRRHFSEVGALWSVILYYFSGNIECGGRIVDTMPNMAAMEWT